MRRPVLEIPKQAELPLGFGTQLEDLLFPEEIDGKCGGDGVGKQVLWGVGEVLGNFGEEQGVAGFVEIDELLSFWRIGDEFVILEEIDGALEQRILREEFQDAEGRAADGDDVHASVFKLLDDFEDFGGATDADDAVLHGEEHAKGRLGIEAFADHAAIARFKNVQGKLFAGEKNDVQGEERYAIRPHGLQGLMIAEGREEC